MNEHQKEQMWAWIHHATLLVRETNAAYDRVCTIVYTLPPDGDHKHTRERFVIQPMEIAG